jgi:hypothetical protein
MGNGGSDNSDCERANVVGSRDGDRLQELLQQAVATLRAGDVQKAGQLLIAAQGAGQLPERFAILPELARQLGPELLSKLLSRLATFPCFYCRNGLQRCEACDGRGRLSDDVPCERCVGLGVARCDFCDGSGWVSLEAVPPSLRPLVILQRVRLALRSSRNLLAHPPAASEVTGGREARKQAARQVVAVERQRAILDEALATAERSGINSRIGKELDKLLPACAACVPPVESRLRHCLGELAEAARLAADMDSSDPSLQRRARSRTSYYDVLRRSDAFVGTGLDRPRLREALRQIGQRAQGSSDMHADDSEPGSADTGGGTIE